MPRACFQFQELDPVSQEAWREGGKVEGGQRRPSCLQWGGGCPMSCSLLTGGKPLMGRMTRMSCVGPILPSTTLDNSTGVVTAQGQVAERKTVCCRSDVCRACQVGVWCG